MEMLATIEIKNQQFKFDLNQPLDLSIPIMAGKENVNAFYLDPVTYVPFQAGSFIGDVKQGGSCNVKTITINPHGNGTHTETVGHISKENFPIRNALKKTFFTAIVISISPENENGAKVINLSQVSQLNLQNAEALIIRTLPNSSDKKTFQYSGTNPTYMSSDAAKCLASNGIEHLLLDFPSIDKEDDGGLLLAHHAFWNYPQNPREHCTISELIFVDNSIEDGFYLLDLQFGAFDIDASPSRPILYRLNAV